MLRCKYQINNAVLDNLDDMYVFHIIRLVINKVWDLQLVGSHVTDLPFCVVFKAHLLSSLGTCILYGRELPATKKQCVNFWNLDLFLIFLTTKRFCQTVREVSFILLTLQTMVSTFIIFCSNYTIEILFKTKACVI